MKKIYLLILLMPGISRAYDSIHKEDTIETHENRVSQQDIDQLDESPVNEVAEDENIDRTVSNLEDDDFFGDSLDKMIEMGAVDEEVEVKPMPFWKVWLLRIGSNVLAKLETLKNFMSKQYDNAKYVVAAAWAKVTGKRLPKRVRQNKTKKNVPTKRLTHEKHP